MIRTFKIGIYIIHLLFIINVCAQLPPCNPLTSTGQTTFVNCTGGSNTSFTNNISGSGWTPIGNPNILITDWISSSNDPSGSFIVSPHIIAAPTSTDNKMLGAAHGEGIKANFNFDEPGKYLLRFSQTNVRKYRNNQPPSSMSWVIKLAGTTVGESVLMRIFKADISWHQSLIVFDVTTPGNYELSIVANEEGWSFDTVVENASDDHSPIMSYMLIDNISLIQEGDCEEIPVLQDKDNSSFAPKISNDYVISAWVKEEHINPVMTYTSGITVSFESGSSSPGYNLLPSGNIIDGWQRIEGTFSVPGDASMVKIVLDNALFSSQGTVYYDDVRIHSADGNMKSFVYDPINQRLMAELDENNYATLYEYDFEGGLIRVKKETEKGIYTIQETRSANYKQNE